MSEGTIKRLLHSTFGSYDHVDADAGEVNFSAAVRASRCPCCVSPLRRFVNQLDGTRRLELDLCVACGWWHMHRVEDLCSLGDESLTTATWWELYHAVLSELPVDLPSLPLEQLQLHLARSWEDRTQISAQQAEDLVAGVLKEHYGGDVLRVGANASAADGGIDLFIVSKDGLVKRAVQVKRRQGRESEPVGEVRNFVGAMLLQGATYGAFVTTASQFTEPAKALTRNPNLRKHRLSVELVDGDRLLELLEYSNRAVAVRVPPLVAEEGVWTATDGRTYSTGALFLGDLRRLRRPSDFRES